MMLARTFPSLAKVLKNFPPVLHQTCVKQHVCRFFSKQDNAQFELERNHRDIQNGYPNESSATMTPLTIVEQLKQKGQRVLGAEIVAATNTIAKLCRKQETEFQYEEPKFLEDLCNIIDSHCHKLQINEATKILEDLSGIELSPSSSEVITHILQHASNLLDSSSIQNFNRLARVILKMPQTPMTNAIINGINRKFSMRLSLDFDKNDLDFLEKALDYATSHLKNKKVTENIVGAIIDGNFDDMPHSSALSILKSILKIENYPKIWLPFMQYIQDIVINNAGVITISEITFILQLLNRRITKEGREEFYNQKLFDKFIQLIIWNDPGQSREVYHCLESLIDLQHLDKSFLNYLSAKYYEMKYVRKYPIENESMKLSSLVSGLAYLKHKPMFWDGIFESCRKRNFSSYTYEHLLIYALHLACLDCYDPAVLDMIFSSSYDFTKNKFIHHTYLKLWQKLKIMPKYDGPAVPEKHIETFKLLLDTNPDNCYPLLPYLERGVGGAMFVKTNVKSRLYHNIDHVVAFRHGGFPVALNQVKISSKKDFKSLPVGNYEFIEDLTVPANCHIVPVLCIQPSWYFRNSDSLLGIHSIAVESLEAMSYPVAAISRRTWMSLPEGSKVSYLMNQIFSKLPYDTKIV